jgi:hypothetical protein
MVVKVARGPRLVIGDVVPQHGQLTGAVDPHKENILAEAGSAPPRTVSVSQPCANSPSGELLSASSGVAIGP